MKRFVLLILLFLPFATHAKERIISYNSEIIVHEDGSQTVTETIRVRAEGHKIKRGIYRDFPTVYKAGGRRYKVDFRVVEVRRDGRPESWHTKRQSNGVRVYIGRSDVYLEPGEYTYKLSYFTNRQLGFFENHDELYWNVTGNGWDFAIESATARVILPSTVQLDSVVTDGFTGKQGSTDKYVRAQKTPHAIRFIATRSLGPREGLTIVAGWPKGHVIEPTSEDRLLWLWQDEPGLVIVWSGLMALLIYYWLAWLAVGRDPKAGVIFPEYEPPQGYSPAAIRLIRRMAYDDKTLSAALVSASVKGAITLKERDDEYTAKATGETVDGLTSDEKVLLETVTKTGLTFKNKNHEKVRKLLDGHKEKLDDLYRKRYYYANRGWMILGWMISVAVLGMAGWKEFQSQGPEILFFIFMGGFVTAFGAPFLVQIWRMRHPYRRQAAEWVKLFASGAPAIFLGVMLASTGFSEFFRLMPVPFTSGIAVLVLTNIVFAYLIKAPTLRGRKLLDRIAGFRQYLTLAEGDELKARYATPLTPDKFEAYLPYAIALDVETQWADRFAEDLRKAGQDPTQYRSHWYDGSDFRGVRGISSSVSGALASSVSSSSSPPGSSSGGGGGGFSGGGGGGGGGGGW